MAQWVKDLALSLQWLRLLLRHKLDYWPGNFHMPQGQPKKKKKEARIKWSIAFKTPREGVPVLAQWKQIPLVSMRTRVQTLA